MPTFDVNWTKFTVHKKHDIDRDKPYLWVYGIVIDVDTLESHDYVVKRRCDSDDLGGKKFNKGDTSTVPSDLDLGLDVNPLLGQWAGGVAVVAWENAMTHDDVIGDAYDSGADALNDAIGKQLKSSGIAAPTDDEMAVISADVTGAVRNTITDEWTVFQAIPDNNIGSASTVQVFTGTKTIPLDFRFKHGSTDYELEGKMAYNAAESKPSGPSSPPPPPPPGKVLQSPPPSAPVRH